MISKEVLEEHKKEIEYKLIATFTNIQSLNLMLSDLEEEIKKANKEQIKTLEIQKDQLVEQKKTNEKSVKIHKANLEYINNFKF